jgi:hypothetical protein
MNGLDALATAIMWREGEPGFRPPARSFRNCNPGNLRARGAPSYDAGGFGIYPDVGTGYQDLVDDLADKFTDGKNEHGLGQASTLLQLIDVYAPGQDGNDPNSYAAFAATWVSLAIGKPITVASLLSEIWAPSTS